MKTYKISDIGIYPFNEKSDMFLSLMIDGRNVILSIKQAYVKTIAV